MFFFGGPKAKNLVFGCFWKFLVGDLENFRSSGKFKWF